MGTTEIKKLVKLSDYMESRRFNRKLYSRLIEKIEKNVKHIAKDIPDLEITISMSAKYQTPYVKIEADGKIPQKVGHIEREVIDALDEVGFTHNESEEKEYGYFINFTDSD